MNLPSMRKEISDLRDSLLYKYEPVCKAFIIGAKDTYRSPNVKPTGKLIPHTSYRALSQRLRRRESGIRSFQGKISFSFIRQG